jgi:L-fucose isomerase-like protein
LLWHCGPFPTDLARYPDKAKLVDGRGFYELKHGEVTLARVDSHKGEYTMFIGNAKGIEGPKTNGGYLWVEVDDWPKWERKLIEGPYIHHIVGVHSQVADIMREACKYIPQLRPDPV